MALFRRKKSGRRGSRVSPFKAGLVALVVVIGVTGFVFTKYNPLADPYELKATFASANSLKATSPVRIAGVNVGVVKKVEPMEDGSGAALVTMEIEEAGLPIHEDAELKVRPRIFLEGNFFVDIQPGSPSAPIMEKGEDKVIPVNQTAAPVQFSQLLTALQSDTREDLRTFLAEYSLNALKGEGAAGFNRSIQYWEDAYRNTALANTALLGTEDGDLGKVLRGQAKVAAALAKNPQKLKDFVSDFNTTAAALSADPDSLAQVFPELRDVLAVGMPALQSLNGSLPSLSAFARDALPGTRSSLPTINASIPLVRELRGLVSEEELGGLSEDLRETIPALSRLNTDTIPFLEQNRLLSSCQNQVILPFAKSRIPNGDSESAFGDGSPGNPFRDFPDRDSTDQRVYEQLSRSLVGLAGESRLFDGNGQLFRVALGGGPGTIVRTGDFGGLASDDTRFVTPTPLGPAGEFVRPAPPAERPQFRPGVRCETQQPPNLSAPAAAGANASNGELIQAPVGDVRPILENIPQLPALLPNARAVEANQRRLEATFDRALNRKPGDKPGDPETVPPAGKSQGLPSLTDLGTPTAGVFK